MFWEGLSLPVWSPVLVAILLVNGIETWLLNKIRLFNESKEEKPLLFVTVNYFIKEVQDIRDPIEAKSFEGKKVQLSGSIAPGRFIVKKNRGN